MTRKPTVSFGLFFGILFFLFCTIPATAQGSPKKILSDKDIDALIATYDRIVKDLGDLGSKYEDNLVELSEGASISAAFAKVRTTTAPAEVESVLERNGLGKNGFEKMAVITYGYAAIMAEESLVDEDEIIASDPSMKPYFDDLRKQISDIKANIHPDDLKLIKANKNDLSDVLDARSDDGYDDETTDE